MRSLVQRIDLKLVNKLKNHKISFHLPHRYRSSSAVKQKKQFFAINWKCIAPEATYGVAVIKSFACSGYVSERPICLFVHMLFTCLDDCWDSSHLGNLHGDIKKCRILVINFHSIRNKINEIEFLSDNINPDEISGSWITGISGSPNHG